MTVKEQLEQAMRNMKRWQPYRKFYGVELPPGPGENPYAIFSDKRRLNAAIKKAAVKPTEILTL